MTDVGHEPEAPVLSGTIEGEFDPRRNSLGFLRMVFAVMVLIDHSFPLGGFHGGTDPMWGWTNGQESLGGLAVAGFFVVSGYLVTKSFFDSNPRFVTSGNGCSGSSRVFGSVSL